MTAGLRGRSLAFALLVVVGVQPLAAQRVQYTINAGWRYHADGLNLAEKPANSDETWERVSIPHTWNASDPFDDAPSYRRGVSWYRTRLPLDQAMSGKRIFLHFEGVNQVADVFVNNAFVGRHEGGYTAFTFDVTTYVKFGAAENVVAVQVDNSHDPFIAPLSVGFALYGGIYRDVWLIATDPLHFTMSDHGSRGISVRTELMADARAAVIISGGVENDGLGRAATIANTILDAGGNAVSTSRQESATRFDARIEIQGPHLWSPEDPYLYTLRSELRDGATVIDRIDTPFGIRTIAFDGQGFRLNGKKYTLRGTNRHQDYAGLGSALSNDLHRRDMEIIKEMGANFVRLAHYPQDPAVLEAADRLGLLVWEEIPNVNYMTPDPRFVHNAEVMMREMIRQHRNHPSVIVWGTMNEIFLWGPGAYRIGKQNNTTYMRAVRDFSAHMDSLTRAEDPSRYSTMAIHGSADYDSSGVANQSQVLGLNLYDGWYSGTFAGFGTALDRRHARMPNRPIFVSEYGAEDDYRVNSLEPERFDFSNTWMRRYHESYLAQINARPWLAGTAIWNEFDFSQPETGGSIPHLNQKGMLTWDRTPKDVYYLYKANWNPAPMVYIASRGWAKRIGTGVASMAQPIDVYSNQSRVELFVNGRSLGVATPDSVKRATWNAPLKPGENVVEARSGVLSDRLVVTYTWIPSKLAGAPFTTLGVNAGSKAQVSDEMGLWIGDQSYATGGFGFVGGTPTIFDKDLAITNTAEPPLYFTFQSGMSAYRFDVPDGSYDVTLMFAEPSAKPGERVFGVSVNGTVVASRLDLSATHGIARAAAYTASVSASGGAGVTVHFTPIQGQAIVNAIRVTRK
ncbi:MAG: glycoside hydrolase family 2 TIM barrel-domain containing protein [bacterium]